MNKKNTNPGNQYINLFNILKEKKHMFKAIRIQDKLNEKKRK